MAKQTTKAVQIKVTEANFTECLANVVTCEGSAQNGKRAIMTYLVGITSAKAVNAFHAQKFSAAPDAYSKEMGVSKGALEKLAKHVEEINKATGNAWQGWKRLFVRHLKARSEKGRAEDKKKAATMLAAFEGGARKQKAGTKTGKKKGATGSKDNAAPKPEDAISIADAVGTGPEMALNILAQVVAGLLQLAGKDGMKGKATAANVNISAAMETLRAK